MANHTCWFDPLWLVQVMPRPLTPLMAGPFYDRPILHWFAVHVFHAIRVPCCNFRREAPELEEAVAALDQGECVLIFPGAWLQRQPGELHRFGQGIWLILKQRPHTPVIPCWIEGGFGSFTSFAGGPPLKNKWPDLWRPINIAVGTPLFIGSSLLSDGETTRNFLRHQCLKTRDYLYNDQCTLPVK
jgi:1-acyl-sn-glycerol-3-phosphate acyltransferase